MPAHDIVPPASVAPKLKICATVAGAAGVLTKFFPPTPVATTKTRRNGIQAQFWYLKKVRETLGLFLMEVKRPTS